MIMFQVSEHMGTGMIGGPWLHVREFKISHSGKSETLILGRMGSVSGGKECPEG